jgi:hypothetical protein
MSDRTKSDRTRSEISDRAKLEIVPAANAETGVHPVVIEIALGAALWFLAVTWVSFARGTEVDWAIFVATAFFGIFFGLFLLIAARAAKEPRWRLRQASFRDFLHSKVGTETGEMSGRQAMIEIITMPLMLAFAATAIGIAWILAH